MPAHPVQTKPRRSNVRGEVILAVPLRTPIGKFGGALSRLSAAELGAAVARAVVDRSGVPPGQIDEVIFGNARQAGGGPNVARQIAHRAGIPPAVPAWTVNQACGSGLRAVISACQAIRLEEARVILAGGVESMSALPYFLPEARFGRRAGHLELVDGMYRDGFLCPLCGLVMGETAENLAGPYGIGRAEQDRFAAESQSRCERARREGRFREEIVPVEVPGDGGPVRVEADEHPRPGVTPESLAGLPPAFRPGGTVHAGNSSGITDGAAAVLVASRAAAESLRVEPIARVVDHCTVGVDPARMGLGPVPAVRRILERNGLAPGDIDLVELNEAFAVQVLACLRDLGLDPERVNVNGGAIALGHPIGATGARILVTLLHEMRRRGARRGLATLCVSGGLGAAFLVEAIAARPGRGGHGA
ncbi:MAG: thiolase family protein [Acidobacteria bacterium]|nr:thiolase family protein [Acidobacteriota bacterium]